jgi:general secretion pathway protein G
MNATRIIRQSRKGFTLVEILIVVIILGILAAIVIPQFTNASQDARRNNLRSTVATLRAQVALYKMQHGDTLPDLVTNWDPLLNTSTYAGTTYGPYLQEAPINQLTNNSVVANGTASTTPTAAQGFIYDYNAGAGSGQVWGVDKTGASTYAILQQQ